MGRKKGRTIEAYERDQKALELRKEGHTYSSTLHSIPPLPNCNNHQPTRARAR